MTAPSHLHHPPSRPLQNTHTTGLDSFQALSVMGAMRALARSGRTVVAAIHQPRSSIYDLLDSLVLVSEVCGVGWLVWWTADCVCAATLDRGGVTPPSKQTPQIPQTHTQTHKRAASSTRGRLPRRLRTLPARASSARPTSARPISSWMCVRVDWYGCMDWDMGAVVSVDLCVRISTGTPTPIHTHTHTHTNKPHR